MTDYDAKEIRSQLVQKILWSVRPPQQMHVTCEQCPILTPFFCIDDFLVAFASMTTPKKGASEALGTRGTVRRLTLPRALLIHRHSCVSGNRCVFHWQRAFFHAFQGEFPTLFVTRHRPRQRQRFR